MYWSDFYDRILQHPECPDDRTIEDDRRLDEWLRDVQSQNDRKRGKKQTFLGGGDGKKQVHQFKFANKGRKKR